MNAALIKHKAVEVGALDRLLHARLFEIFGVRIQDETHPLFEHIRHGMKRPILVLRLHDCQKSRRLLRRLCLFLDQRLNVHDEPLPILKPRRYAGLQTIRTILSRWMTSSWISPSMSPAKSRLLRPAIFSICCAL